MTTYHGSQAPNFAINLPIGSKALIPKKHPITNDYTILTKCLGVGVNGKVLECIHKATGDRRALKVSGNKCKMSCSIYVCGGSYSRWAFIRIQYLAGAIY